MKQEPDKEPVPMWRKRLVTLIAHKQVPQEVKADIKAALDEIDHLRDALSMLGDA